MKNIHSDIPLNINHLNQMMKETPEQLINLCEKYYYNQVLEAVENIEKKLIGRKIIMLSGPSCAGKTTTAHILENRFEQKDVQCHVVSLDNFYKGRTEAPKNEKGEYDYETIDALNVEQMTQCLLSIVKNGYAQLPVFDFVSGAPITEKQNMSVAENDVVIVEGIHALNPLVVESLPENHLYKLYITVKSTIKDNSGEKVISRRGTRLSRRLIRDFKYRGSSPNNTLKMWNEVEEGENKYLFPYEPNAEFTIDSLHPYEAGMMKLALAPLLLEINPNAENYSAIEKLITGYEEIEPMPLSLLPKNSLLMEFLG